MAGVIFLAFLFQHTGRIRLSGALNILLPAGFLVLMPFAYLYLRTATNKAFEKWYTELLHFIPAFIILLLDIATAVIYKIPTFNLMKPESSPFLVLLAAQIVLWSQFLFYTYHSISLLRKEKPEIRRGFSLQQVGEKKWLILLFLSFGLFSMVMAVMVLDSMVHSKQTDDIIFYILAFIITTLLIGLFALKNKDILSNKVMFSPIDLNIANKDELSLKEDLNNNQKNNGNNKSQMTTDKMEELRKLISDRMSDKIFTDPKLSIEVLAKMINSNSKYVSQVFNDSFGSSFSNYINRLRIEEAKRIFCEHKSARYSIEGVGNMVGFQSKSTFNTQFRKFTGMTPGEYLKKVKG
jgi:AraC-like DNA-binding protein